MYSGKTVLITGSSRGIGKGLKEHFISNGAFVVGIARESDKGDNYYCYGMDLTSLVELSRTLHFIDVDHKKIDILINNAAFLKSNYFVKLDKAEDILTMIDTNLLAPLYLTQEVLKLMKRVEDGRIINISSMAVPLEPMGDSVYAATKASLEKFGNILAKEVSFMGITVNTLGVSAIDTDMLRQLNKEKVDKVVNSLPIPRYATMEDITNVVDFFCSPKSNYITAQTIYLGGVHS